MEPSSGREQARPSTSEGRLTGKILPTPDLLGRLSERGEFRLQPEASRLAPNPVDHLVGVRVHGLVDVFVLRVTGSRLGIPSDVSVLTLRSPHAITVARPKNRPSVLKKAGVAGSVWVWACYERTGGEQGPGASENATGRDQGTVGRSMAEAIILAEGLSRESDETST